MAIHPRAAGTLKQWHPDKNKAADAAERFQRIGAAKDVLSDAVARRTYDAELRMQGRYR